LDIQRVEIQHLEIQPAEVVDFLKKTLQYRSVRESILQTKLVSQTSQVRQIEVKDDAVQAEAERQRRELRLEQAADTFAWLAAQQITPEAWEQGIRDQLLQQGLAEALFGQDVARWFGEHRLDYDRVVLYQIVVPDLNLAQELFYQLEEAEISFYEAAHLYHRDEEGRRRCGYEGALPRWTLPPNLAAAVFGVPIGQVTPPVPTEQGYHLLMIEALITATLTPEIRQEILAQQFQAWLSSELTYLTSSAT
jgi:parvulin-like peptidyl-prolyl isomerase